MRSRALFLPPRAGAGNDPRPRPAGTWRASRAGPRANGVKLGLQRCKIIRVARPGQQVVAGDRLADRIGIGVLAAVFTPELVDRVVEQAGGREPRKRTLPARGGVYLLLAMGGVFHARYPEGWDQPVAGLD